MGIQFELSLAKCLRCIDEGRVKQQPEEMHFSGERLAEVLDNTTHEHTDELLVVKLVSEFERVLRDSLGELRSIKRNKAMN